MIYGAHNSIGWQSGLGSSRQFFWSLWRLFICQVLAGHLGVGWPQMNSLMSLADGSL